MEIDSRKYFLLLVMLYITTVDASEFRNDYKLFSKKHQPLFPLVEVEIDDCKLQLPRLSFFAPLVFTPNGTLKATESDRDNNFVNIANGEEILLSCAPNYFKKIESKFVGATCKGNNVLGKELT